MHFCTNLVGTLVCGIIRDDTAKIGESRMMFRPNTGCCRRETSSPVTRTTLPESLKIREDPTADARLGSSLMPRLVQRGGVAGQGAPKRILQWQVSDIAREGAEPPVR